MGTGLSQFTLEGDLLPGDVETDRFEAVEGISEPYTVVVGFTTQSEGFRVEECLRKRLCLCVVDAAGNTRFYDGVVDQARFVRVAKARRHFEVRLRPALAALAHREGCRIFQEQTLVQVIQTIFDEAGFGEKVTWRNTKEYEPREFVVQYNESHLNFVSRLMEEAGLFYFFHHTADGHTMVVGDDASCFGGEEGAEPVVFSMRAGAFGGEALGRFSRTRALRTSQVHVQDFDFEHPEVPPTATLPAEERWSMPFFEYPGGFFKGEAGAQVANARMRELRRDADVCQGESRAVGLRVGAQFSVGGAAEECLNGVFITTHLVSRGNQTLTGGGEQNYDTQNTFRGIPEGAPYAAPRRARRPRIRGVQTAIVTGSSKQEQALHVDKYGRVKVRFYWDRVGQQDHTSSCWIRVSQANMGGSMILPRVGWEVSVAFLDGDPDRPVILGRVYNAEKTAPYPLPATKASGSIKSLSSPGGGGHNELVMGDSAGKQGVGFHAQKDLNVTVGNDKVEQVGVDEQQHVSVNANSTVGVDETVQVGGDQSLDVGAVMQHQIGGNQQISVGGNDTSNAISNYVEKVGGDRAYSVGGTQITISNGIEQQAQGDFSRSVGSLQLTGSISSINDNILGSLKESSGAIKVQLVNGSHGEQITGDKSQTYAAAELHLTKAGLENKAGASVTNLVGGLHYQKLDGSYVVKAPMITLLGAVGVFRGGGSELKLGGGPIVLKGDKIAVKGGLLVKMSGSMKLGS
ncbi:type VI secretion system Vgr family protein [Chondromyces apiculatus]|uniref:VgrG protein n=1 Tax=Chondromyces apiculatus DSM 436 TaxID=1192034 RepID=A0A017T4K1_9BACT|nr:type VI secretion system tip protein TssI/VgrG [Chondromyces apiculatus]EYF04183.1 VgrG protein [Chondromyces apiculatus DSM 436]